MFPKEMFDKAPKNKGFFEIGLNTKCPNETVLVHQHRQGYFQTRATFASVLKTIYTKPPEAHVSIFYLDFKSDSQHAMLLTNNI